MNKRYLIIYIIQFVVFIVACQNNNDKDINEAMDEDSLKTEITESISVSDIWTKFTFSERQGRQLYEKYCVVCHGIKGEGDGFNSFNLNPRPKNLTDSTYNKALSDESIKKIIAYGGRGVNRSVLMPSYQNNFDEKEIQYLLHYIRTFINN